VLDQKHLESFEMWCWRRMEKISWTDHVRNEDVLPRVKEQRNILHEIRKRKANWIGHILRRNCLLQRVIEGKIQGWIEVTRRQGRRRRKLLDDLMERRRYSHLKAEALDRTMWSARFGRGFGPVVRQTTKWMNYSVAQPCKWNSHALVDTASRTDSVVLRVSTVNEDTLKILNFLVFFTLVAVQRTTHRTPDDTRNQFVVYFCCRRLSICFNKYYLVTVEVYTATSMTWKQ
jgi:hypothetical protein